MVKWEYRCNCTHTLSPTKEFNSLGEDGWEIIWLERLSDKINYVAKRPIESEPIRPSNIEV